MPQVRMITGIDYAALAELLRRALETAVLATEFNKSVSADADILASDLALTQNGILRVTVALSGAAVFKLKLTRGTTTKVLSANSGDALVADSLYYFDCPVRSGDKVNFRPSAGVTVQVLNADLVVAMGP